jgi:hypothetical protein
MKLAPIPVDNDAYTLGVYQFLALPASPGLAPIGEHLIANSRPLAALWTYQCHIGHVNGRLPLDNAKLSAHIACATLVLLDQIDPGHDHTIPVGVLA